MKIEKRDAVVRIRLLYTLLSAFAVLIGASHAGACVSSQEAQSQLQSAGQFPLISGYRSDDTLRKIHVSVNADLSRGIIMEERDGSVCHVADISEVRLNADSGMRFPSWPLTNDVASAWNRRIAVHNIAHNARSILSGYFLSQGGAGQANRGNRFLLAMGTGYAPYRNRSLLFVQNPDAAVTVEMVIVDITMNDNFERLAASQVGSARALDARFTSLIQQIETQVRAIQREQDEPTRVFTNDELEMMSWRTNPDGLATINGRTMLARRFFDAGLRARVNWLQGSEARAMTPTERARVDATFSNYIRSIKRP